MNRRTLGLTVAGAAAAVVLGTGSTVALRAVAQGGSTFSPVSSNAAAACSVPSLPGGVAQVTLSDMGAVMTGRAPLGYRGMGGRGIGAGGMGAGGLMGRGMAVSVSPATVPSGSVSLVVANLGSIVHELVVLPLSGEAQPGQRIVGSDGRVSETGSLGEASATCGAGAGEGIAAGSESWVTLNLKPGRYELVCNLAGHYASGMYTELDITA